MNKTKTQQAIDARIEERQGSSFRRHLGASLIGHPCSRYGWYVFRWAKAVRHRARLLRLFDRGELKEQRFVRWLRDAGVHVVTHDPNTGKQYRVSDHDEHFGGSLDAALFDTPDFPATWVLGEFKTHNAKSFKELTQKGVKAAKFQHYVQMQIYMHYTGMPFAIYFAICKDDDALHIEVVEYAPEVAEMYIERAGKIIRSTVPPERVANASPGWFLCSWCDFKDICFDDAPMAVNCRTCKYSSPREQGTWACQQRGISLTDAAQRKACELYTPITG